MRLLCALGAALIAYSAHAQQDYDSSLNPSPLQNRKVYSTKEPSLPSLQRLTEEDKSLPVVKTPPAKTSPTKSPQLPDKLPFKRAEPGFMKPVPSGPYSTRAVPVENIDAIEVQGLAAPASDVTAIADPASEDPARPTELTSPMFATVKGETTPRTVMVRVLNKVTARSELLEVKPGEAVDSGKLQVRAIKCFRSLPTSQPDTVALLDVSEHVPEQAVPKLLFHGWMYQSSPSITALEHPVYDVTMVDCKTDTLEATDKPIEKPAKKRG